MQKYLFVLATTLLLWRCSPAPPEISGALVQWQPLTMTFEGVETSEDAEPNPFLCHRLGVTFTHEESGKSMRVWGFYAADGNAAETSAKSGSKWRVRFTPPEAGRWTYTVSFRGDFDVALNTYATSGEPVACDGLTGELEIAPAPEDAPGFFGKGMLEYVRGHYLRFQNGEYFLKGGADSPENFLAYAGFDDTYDTAAHEGVETDTGKFIHEYAPHAGDWRPGDPTWQGDKGKNIIGALNYLASKGMNSVYFLTYNIDGGDGKDTWMWTSPEERLRFDVSKLEQWEIVFEHMSRLGIQLHVVTQETENDRKLGGGPGLNDVRKLYLRELVARFAHHPAVIWNLGEENNTPDEDRKEIAEFIREIDPYDHPITVHTKNRRALTFYDGILGDPNFEATSIQGELAAANAEAIALRERSKQAGRPWAVFHDEQTPASHGVLPDADDPSHDGPRKGHLWGNLMGGGSGVEWYFGYRYPHMDLNAEDWRSREKMWDQTRYALEFFHRHLPFWEMWPANELASAKDAYVLAKEGEAYAVYLPNGGSTRLALTDGEFSVRWYDPRNGGELQTGEVETVRGGRKVSIGNPPSDPDQDWVALVRKQ